MLSKKSMKILSIIVMVVMLLMTIGTSMSAAAVTVPQPDEWSPSAGSELDNTIGKVLGIIQWAGIVAAVAIAMFIGIKYITSSPEGKAELKKTLLFYVAGIVILLSASAIVTAIQGAL